MISERTGVVIARCDRHTLVYKEVAHERQPS